MHYYIFRKGAKSRRKDFKKKRQNREHFHYLSFEKFLSFKDVIVYL